VSKLADFFSQPSKGLVNMLDEVFLYKEPFGVALVMGAWNYPLQLTLMPMHGAIAAGNCVILKPSEVSPHSAKLIAELLPKYLDQVLFFFHHPQIGLYF